MTDSVSNYSMSSNIYLLFAARDLHQNTVRSTTKTKKKKKRK